MGSWIYGHKDKGERCNGRRIRRQVARDQVRQVEADIDWANLRPKQTRAQRRATAASNLQPDKTALPRNNGQQRPASPPTHRDIQKQDDPPPYGQTRPPPPHMPSSHWSLREKHLRHTRGRVQDPGHAVGQVT